MNIKILDSWLREYLDTKAKPAEIAEKLSLTSVSVERLEKFGQNDWTYDIEVTTNRPDLMSIIGLAREAAAVLPEAGIEAKFIEPKFGSISNKQKLELEIISDPKLVNRICAVALDVRIGESPKYIQERLTSTDINPHNNLIDVTNYVMREVGHPMHAFDYDKLMKTGKMLIREAKAGEKIIDLHGEEHSLAGGDIVADDGTGTIIDLLAVIGTQNSAVEDTTKRVLLFVDNDNHHKIRKTSMSLGIRTDAAILNEKGVDPELAYQALVRGAKILEEIASAKIISEITDIFPNKFESKTVSVTEDKINTTIGIEIPIKISAKILTDLGFEAKIEGEKIITTVPSWRANDVTIPEDLIEEIARVYGYFRLPSVLPQDSEIATYSQSKDLFYWEGRVRAAMKYWGFSEIYTYPMVSENLLEGPTSEAVIIKNPLTEDHVYMRKTLVPSLLEAARENKNRDQLKIFEIANVYHKKSSDLPEEKLMLAAVFKHNKVSFFEAKGVVENILDDLGIKNYEFKQTKSGGSGADIYIGKALLGEIELLEQDLLDFELDFDVIFKNASSAKIYKPLSKFPEAVEDLRFEIDPEINFEKIAKLIKEQSNLVKSVGLLDVYQNKKTFRIIYQSNDRNLTAEDLTPIREKIIATLKKTFKAELS